MTNVGRLIDLPWRRPTMLDGFLRDAERLGILVPTEDRTGALLATLATSKPGGRFLAMGTSVGPGATWLLDGMSSDATLTVVENDQTMHRISARHFGADRRVSVASTPGPAWLAAYRGPRFDLAYIDCQFGDFAHQDEVIGLLNHGGLYLGDNLTSRSGLEADHDNNVEVFLDRLPGTAPLRSIFMRWSSGVVLAARV